MRTPNATSYGIQDTPRKSVARLGFKVFPRSVVEHSFAPSSHPQNSKKKKRALKQGA